MAIFVLTLLFLMLSACSNRPGEMVEEMQDVLCDDGQIAAMLPYVTPSSVQTINMLSALTDDPRKGAQVKNEIQSSCQNKDEIVKEEIKGDFAVVTFASGKTQRLQKIDGEWKAIISK